MASQQTPARPWFRLASMVRPTAVPAPAPAPAQATQPPLQPGPQPRPAFSRVQTFRPPVPQPQESASPPTPPPPPPPPPPATTATSVPSSPTIKVLAPSSLPTSPAALPVASSSSVPPSPKTKISSPSSVPTSPPAPKSSPAPAAPPTAPSSSVPPSPKVNVVSAAPTSWPTSVFTRALPSSSPPPPPASAIPRAVPSSPPPPPTTSLFPRIVSSSPPPPPPPTTSLFPRIVSSSPPPPPPSPTTAALTAVVPPPPSPITDVRKAFIPLRPAPAPAPASTSSPKILKALTKTPPSPKIKPVSAPLSPLTLPPAQIKSESGRELRGIPAEAQQKTILVQETSEKPKMVPKTSHGDLQRQTGETDRWRNGEDRKWEVKKGVVETKERGMYKKGSESEEHGMSIVTIAGENKGAIMELSPSGQRNGFGGKPHVLQKTGNKVIGRIGEKSSSSSSSDEDGRSKGKDKSLKSMGKTSAAPMKAFMNSNVQSVNSSIIFNSSCTHHDPGVHFSLSRKSKAGPEMQLKD